MKPYLYISETNLQILTAVMKSRIAKGFKAEDLSFLIGRAPFYISNVECGVQTFYSEEDITLISAALNEPIPYADHANRNLPMLKVSLERHLYQCKYYHICTCYSDTGKEYVQFIFNEDVNMKPELHITQLEKYQKNLIIKTLNEMISNGYFSQPKWAYQIYQHLNHQLGLSLSPQMLREILNDFCLDDDIGGLEKRFENENYQYIINAAQLKCTFLTLNQNKPCLK